MGSRDREINEMLDYLSQVSGLPTEAETDDAWRGIADTLLPVEMQQVIEGIDMLLDAAARRDDARDTGDEDAVVRVTAEYNAIAETLAHVVHAGVKAWKRRQLDLKSDGGPN